MNNLGLHCDSEFLADINSQTRYEGEHIFSIFSTHDDKVGVENVVLHNMKFEDRFPSLWTPDKSNPQRRWLRKEVTS